MYHHQSDTVSRHLQIDGITAPEMVPEQFLPFLRWNANPRVFHFHTPYMPVREGTDLDTPARGVYFSALDSIFFNIESILSLSNRTFR